MGVDRDKLLYKLCVLQMRVPTLVPCSLLRCNMRIFKIWYLPLALLHQNAEGIKVIQTRYPWNGNLTGNVVFSDVPFSTESTICMKIKSFQFYQYFKLGNDYWSRYSVNQYIFASDAYGTLFTTPAVECGEFWYKCIGALKSKLGTFWKYGKVFVEFLEVKGGYFHAWKPDIWNKLCFVRNNVNIKIYYNGILVTVQRSFHVENKRTNITLMLDEGNESQMFGAISDFNIWDRILTREEIEKWSHCQLNFNGNILNWNNPHQGMHFLYYY